jgi:hypothetical protein
VTFTAVFLTAILMPAAEPSAAQAATHVSLGMNSCTASACHGGSVAAAGKQREWNSSYTVWATKDPHADAYAVLFSERSQRIVARLVFPEKNDPKKTPKEYRSFLEKRCATCHATIGEGRPSPDGFAEDGVSCASCHGSAGEWLGDNHAGRKAGQMKVTQQLTARAEVCVVCHVGSPAHNGEPAREVNHDLIAAGHPRLNFEFSAYLNSLPAHWDLAKDRDRVRRPDGAKKAQANFAAEAWLAGQFVAANAALDLLESRAKADGGSDKEHTWPEFSEISCYSCHHELRSHSYRQKLFRRETPANRRSPIGSLVWGTWYSPMPRHALLTEQPPAVDGEALWLQLGQTMSVIHPDSKNALSLTAALRPTLKRPANSLQTVARLAKSLPSLRGDWDEIAQWYLATNAWHRALWEEHLESQTSGVVAPSGEREAALRDSQFILEKIRGQLESPLEFDPTGEAFQDAVKLLLQQLAKLEG